MVFDDRSEFINKQASEKIVLAHVEANQRLYNWNLYATNIYSKVTEYFVVDVYQGLVGLTQSPSLGGISEGTWFYDSETSTLYVQSFGNVDPSEVDTISTYRLFFANRGIAASWDLSDSGKHVNYEGRVRRIPGYKHKIGVEQGLSSLVGSGTLQLENVDGGLDGVFDTVYFENRAVRIYSWNPDLDFSEAQIVYRGRVTNKTYNTSEITFKVKDAVFDLQQSLPLEVFDDTDNVVSSVQGRYKRWVYGRVDGLQVQSIDQIGDGYAITGTVSGTVLDAILTGVGTAFLSELSPGDKLTINTQEFDVEEITSDTSLLLSQTPTFAFSGSTCIVVPEIPTTSKNREFFVAGHATTRQTKTLVSINQLNRVKLSDTLNLAAGEFIEFDTGERIQIKNLAPGNIAVLVKNLTTSPTISSDVFREPIQSVYVQGNRVPADEFTITNLGAPSNETKIAFGSDLEFNLTRTVDTGITLTFTNGSRDVTYTGDLDLNDSFTSRDWLRPESLTFTTYYEILSVNEGGLKLRAPFADPNHTGPTEVKRPEYIGDSTIVSVDVFGKTKDGEPEGVWIKTNAEVDRDVLTELDIVDVNEQSFIDGAATNAQLVSLALPTSISGQAPTGKNATDLMNKSTLSALTVDNDLNMKFVTNLFCIENPVKISDKDVVSWSIKTSNGKTFRDSIVNYRFTDVDNSTLESGNRTVTHLNEFIQKYIGTKKSSEFDLYLYYQTDAEIFSHRITYFNQLSRADITLSTDLRLEGVEIGDVVELDFDRLYKRLGDSTTRKKLVMVVGREVTGTAIKLILTDYGNVFNTSSKVTENTASDYSAAGSEEKLINGYITDNNGITNDDENTVNIHLIV